MAVLRGISGDTKSISFELTKDETTIGRHGANMLVISDASISAFHCAIVKAGGNYTLRDLDSTNGTKVNDEPIKVRRLTAGDLIHVGNVELMLEGDDIEGAESEGRAPAKVEEAPLRGQPASPPVQSQFKAARRNAAMVTWVTIGAITVLSAVLVAVVAYKISNLK